MAESMKGLHRTCRCAEVTKDMVGSKVTLMGWVQKAGGNINYTKEEGDNICAEVFLPFIGNF